VEAKDKPPARSPTGLTPAGIAALHREDGTRRPPARRGADHAAASLPG